ncbi:MAG TPA: ATP-binding protein [Vicinamibacterales bacterium]
MPQPSLEPTPPPTPGARTPDTSPEVRAPGEGFKAIEDIDALARVAAVVGHELTNVLQILSNSIDRLADPVATGSAVVRMARASLDRGVRLARQLQAFSRMTPPRVQRLDAHQALAAWLPVLEEALGPDRILELRLRFGGAILVDPAQLQSAIVHLLTNARDATEPGAVVLVELSRVERVSGPACRIAVTDRGTGMSEEVVRQAVEPFFTTHAPGQGLGLGLTIARMVAESHGGYLEIDSRLGMGTTVSISLPIANGRMLTSQAATAGTSPAASSQTPETATPPASGVTAPPATRPPSAGRILVVDDEEAIAEYFRIVLATEGFDVEVVPSVQRAIETFGLDPQRFDAVLLDMMLGDGSGLDLYRRVRDERPGLPIVVCTGFAENESLEVIRRDGHDVLLKPCTRQEVLRAVQRAVARRRSAF